MNIIKEMYESDDLNINGRKLKREAVRGVIKKGEKFLLVYSRENKDYKFPGGGIKRGEDHRTALRRELKEEVGAIMTENIDSIGKIIQYNKPIEHDFDVFHMDSYYYSCSVEDKLEEQDLDEYEAILGFEPRWVTLKEAIEQNERVLANEYGKIPRWTKRETYMLKWISGNME